MNEYQISTVYILGKTYLENLILAKVRSNSEIALAVASSGIASLLLDGGRTAHSRFKIPLELDSSSICSISKQSDTAKLLRDTKLIIWDEAPMMNKFAFEAVNRTLQDLCDSEEIFGGKVVVLSGDFRQVLNFPIISRNCTKSESSI